MGARVRRRNHSERQPSRAVTDHRLHVEREHTDSALSRAIPDVAAKTKAKIDATREQIDEQLEREHERAKQQVEAVAPEAKPAVEAAAAAAESAIEEERRYTDREVRKARDEASKVVDGVLSQHRHETNRALADERTEADTRIEARDEFFATISHDLRNLINVIQLKSRLLKNELTGEQVTARGRQLADEIHRSTRMMLRWSKDLVDLASVEAGQLRIEFAEEDVVAVVWDAVEICATLAEEKGVAVEVDVPERPCSIDCDADRIVEVLINLLENATRHTARGGKITISLDDHDAAAVSIRVRDTGVGIAQDHLSHVFDRYFQAKRTTRTGVGMGLYISRHIVERHGGQIFVESAPGKGSTFSLTLPRSRPTAEPKA